ncbi:MAG: type IX secretion system outer membrane channel protein PorV [Flavobacteriales bacterium]|nr:type IX secretion system outer membrane channel protein PorV [Flavobacteriales bacterium]
MKKTTLFLLFCCLSIPTLYGQKSPSPIRTAVPFLSISPDATSAAMADAGVATHPDVYSQFHNPAKYAFANAQSSISISYTPWLQNITGDMFLGYLAYFHHLKKNGTLATSLRVFSLGAVEMTDYISGQVIPLGTYNPMEMVLDVSYSMRLSSRLSMGFALRYTRSDISERSDPSTDDFHAGNAISADFSLYYTSREYRLERLKISYSWGINIRDIGSKIDYGSSSLTAYDYLPTTLSLGGGIHLHHKEKNIFSIYIETAKLLVPTPVWNEEKEAYITPDEGILSSMWDALTYAPGGFGEKISEYTLQCALQWEYDKRYAIRAGWYYSDPIKGGIQSFTMGGSATYKRINISMAYAIPLYSQSPTSSSIRISIAYELGREKK